VQPSSILSYYPTYSLLDEARALGQNPTNVNLFIDLKNVLRGIYLKDVVENVVESSNHSRFVDTSIFSSLITFLSFHKLWAYKRNVNINFFIFFETGHSVYHLNIDKDYKCSRKIASVYGVDVAYQEKFFEILHNNLQLSEKICSVLPSVYVLRLHNLECDFIPYYLLTRAKFGQNPNQVNIIYSNDKDMWQTISERTFVFSKAGKEKKLIIPGFMKRFLKGDCDIDDSYFPLTKSIWGDKGDDIIGVNQVGNKSIIDMFSELQPMIGSMEDVYDNIQNKLPMFNMIPSKIENKKLKRVIDAELDNGLISKNVKLVSFEMLSREVDDPTNSKMYERKDHIKKMLNDKKIIELDVIQETLDRFDVTLDDGSLKTIYHL